MWPMRRYLAIFLLVLLPLQYSWAAMASYCEHETSVTAKHPGHHTHDHASVDHQESSKNSPNRRAWTMTVPLAIWVVQLLWSTI
jgi:hypothetical protein